MLRSEVIDTTRHFMILDEVSDPRAVTGRSKPMSRELMLSTLDHNHPRWREIVGIESKVEAIIVEAYRKHRIPE